jgi:hypothetical protein
LGLTKDDVVLTKVSVISVSTGKELAGVVAVSIVVNVLVTVAETDEFVHDAKNNIKGINKRTRRVVILKPTDKCFIFSHRLSK